MMDLRNVEFKYMEKGTKIGEIVNGLVKDLKDEKLEIKEFDLSVMPLVVRLMTNNMFEIQYDGKSKLIIFINNDYDIKLGMNSGIIDLPLLKNLTKFLIELNRRIKKYVEDIKDLEEKENNKDNIQNKDLGKEELIKLISGVFLEVLSGGFDKDGE
jgi:hypothetical protein